MQHSETDKGSTLCLGALAVWFPQEFDSIGDLFWPQTSWLGRQLLAFSFFYRLNESAWLRAPWLTYSIMFRAIPMKYRKEPF